MSAAAPRLLAVYVSDDELARATKFASERGISRSAWARRVLFGEIDRRICVTRHPNGDVSYMGPDLLTMIELTLHIHECEESRKARGAGPTPAQKAEIEKALTGDGGFGW